MSADVRPLPLKEQVMQDFSFVDYAGLPESLCPGMRRWIEQGVQPGSFLSACICNNLHRAVTGADGVNRSSIYAIVIWFYNEAPAPCWGSVEKARAWAMAHGGEFEEKR